MSGIYLHIPFCKTKCHYCDFYSVVKTGGRSGFASLLISEIEFRNQYLPDNKIDTIYFGGGTPSLLPVNDLKTILDGIRKHFQVSPDAEITLEANPDDLTPELIEQYLGAGFNRISIGTQSFFDEHLRFMNRRHDAAQSVAAIKMAAGYGFGNISLDLIYGIPGMTPDQWKHNLDVAVSLPACHISAYHLTIEPGTKFGRLKRAGQFSEIPDEQSVEQYQILISHLDKHGYEQYEISNFARDGKYSRHNAKYWTGEPYLGLGPSAHSFNGSHRHWNPASLARYTLDIKSGKEPDGEMITQDMRRNEYVMTRLRTAAGIEHTGFTREFGESAWQELIQLATRPLKRGWLILENERIYFDRLAWFHSDGILSDLFIAG